MVDSFADTQSYMVKGTDRSLGSSSKTSPTRYDIIATNIPQKRSYTSVYNADSVARYPSNARSDGNDSNNSNDINNIDGTNSLLLSDDFDQSSSFTSLTDAPYSTISSPFRYPSDIWDDSAMIDQQLEEDQQRLSFISYNDVEGDNEGDLELASIGTGSHDNQITLDSNYYHNQSNLQDNLASAHSQQVSSFGDSIRISDVEGSSFGGSIRISDAEGTSFGDSIRISDVECSSFGDSICISDIEDSDTESTSTTPPSSTKAEQAPLHLNSMQYHHQQHCQQSENNNDLHQVTIDSQLIHESDDDRYGSNIWLEVSDLTGIIFEDEIDGDSGSNNTATCEQGGIGLANGNGNRSGPVSNNNNKSAATLLYGVDESTAGSVASDDDIRVATLADDVGGSGGSTTNSGGELLDGPGEHALYGEDDDNNVSISAALFNVGDFDDESVYDFDENERFHSGYENENDNGDELNVNDSPPFATASIINSGEHLSEKASGTNSITRKSSSVEQPAQNYDLDDSKKNTRRSMATSGIGVYSVSDGQSDNRYNFGSGCDVSGHNKGDDCMTNLMDSTHRTYTNSRSQAVPRSPRPNRMGDPSTFHDSNNETSHHQNQYQGLERKQHNPSTSIISASVNEGIGTKNDTSDHFLQQKQHQTSIDSFYSQLSTGSSLSTAKSFPDSYDSLYDSTSPLPPSSQQRPSPKSSKSSSSSPLSSQYSSTKPSSQQRSPFKPSSSSISPPAFEEEIVLSCSPPRKNPGLASLDQLRMEKIKKRSTSSPKEEEKWLPASRKSSLSLSSLSLLSSPPPPPPQSLPPSSSPSTSPHPHTLSSTSSKHEQEKQLDENKAGSPPPTTITDLLKCRPRRPILGLSRPKNTSCLISSSSTPSIASMLGRERHQISHSNNNTLRLNDTITKSTPPRKKTLGMARQRVIIPK